MRRRPLLGAGLRDARADREASGDGAYAAYALGLLTLINLLNYTDRNVIFALFEHIKRELTLSDQQLGWLGSAYVVVLSLAALPLGVIGDLRSRRAVIAFGVGLWSAFTALGAAVHRFWQLLVCRSLVGVGEAGYGPAAQELIAEFYQGRRRAFAIGVYSVGMAFGGVLGIWLGGVLAERYGWRAAFVAVGVPGFLLAILASRLREPRQRPPAPMATTLQGWFERGRRQAMQYGKPLIGLALAGAALSGLLDLFEGLPPGIETAVFAAVVSVGIIWTVVRLVPAAVRRTTEATEVAATAFGEFLQAAATVLRTPTLIWMFLGGALVTFAVNGLIAWAPSFPERPTHRGHRQSVRPLQEARRPRDEAVHRQGDERAAPAHPDQRGRAEHDRRRLEKLAERRGRDLACLGGAAHRDGDEPHHRPDDPGAHAGRERRRVEPRRQTLEQIERARDQRPRDGQPDQRSSEDQGLSHPRAPALIPRLHGGPDGRGRMTLRLPQSRREQREQEAGDAHRHEHRAPGVEILGQDAAQPDPQDAAERHPHRVDADREGALPALEELGDQRLRRRAVAGLADPHHRATEQQLPEAAHRGAQRREEAPQPDPERDHGAPRLQVSHDAERERRERQHDHVGRAEPAELLVRQHQRALDRLEQREDDVAIGVVEEIDEREQPQGVGGVRPGAGGSCVRLRACARQSSPPRASRGRPSPPDTPPSAAASSRRAGRTVASGGASCAARARRRRGSGSPRCCRDSTRRSPAACRGRPCPSSPPPRGWRPRGPPYRGGRRSSADSSRGPSR